MPKNHIFIFPYFHSLKLDAMYFQKLVALALAQWAQMYKIPNFQMKQNEQKIVWLTGHTAKNMFLLKTNFQELTVLIPIFLHKNMAAP